MRAFRIGAFSPLLDYTLSGLLELCFTGNLATAVLANATTLISALLKLDQDIVDLLQRLHEFENLAAELENKIGEGEEQLKSHKIIPREARTERHVEALKVTFIRDANLDSFKSGSFVLM